MGGKNVGTLLLEILIIARFSDVFLVLSTTLGLLVLSAIALLAIIPPSILFSYLVMRRTTQRVQNLTANVGKLIQSIVATAAPVVWRIAKIDVVAEVPSELPEIVVDVNRLEQVIQNLIHKAVRHTSPGGIVAVQVTVEAEAVLFQVKDTGEGISPDDLPHIWERFYQSERSRTRLNRGAGLGLALVKEWIEEMGGTVSVESILGEGSCFTLRLLRADACNDETGLQRQRLDHQEKSSRS